MKRLFLGFLVFASVVFAKNQNNIPEAQIDASSIFQSKSKKLAPVSSSQNILSVLDNYSYIAQQMIKEEKICQQQYQMSLQQKKYLLSRSYDEIVDRLLAQKDLTDEQIWLLWQEYKNKRKWDWSNEKVYTENDLKDGLEKRKRDRQKQEQVDEKRRNDERKALDQQKKLEGQQRLEHQKLLQKYDPKILRNSSCHSRLDLEYSLISSYQQSREQALNQTIFDGGKKHVKTYDIDLQTKAFMQTQGIDHRQFESLSGTIFSHQLFQECTDHYKKAAKVIYEYGMKNSILIPHLVEFTKAALIGTQHEQFALAVQLSDVAEVLADISVGACKGVIKYAADMIDLARNPKQLEATAKHLTYSLLRSTQTLGAALATYDQEGVVGITNLQRCSQSFGDDMILFNQMCDLSREHFKEWYQKSSVQDKAQAVSEILMDGLVTPFLVGKAMKACGGILFRAKESINLARAVELAEELGLGFQEAEELLFATEAGIQNLPAGVAELETSVTSMMESEVSIAKNSGWFSDVYSVQSFVENIQNIRLKNAFYKNNLLQKEAIKYFEQYIYEQKLLEFCKGIDKQYSIMMVEDAGKKIEMLCDPQHIMLPDLDFKTSTRLQRTNGIIGGGHIDISIQALQKNGFVKVVSQEELFGGCKALEMEHLFGDGILKKTIWPCDWTAQQIMEAIKEAWHNQFFIHKEIFQGSTVLTIHGKTSANIEIEMIIKIISENKIKLKTAYPYNPKFSRYPRQS